MSFGRRKRFIVDFLEEQPLGRCRLAGEDSVLFGKHFVDPIGFVLSEADFDERADNVSDHVVQKAVRFYLDGQVAGLVKVGRGNDPAVSDISDRGQSRGAVGFETGKITVSDDSFGCVGHGFKVHVTAESPAVSS